jgi:WD40 repeat protein
VGTTAQVWDVATGKPVSPRLNHQHYLFSVAFSPDGRRLLTVGNDGKSRTGEAHVWDVLTGQSVGTPIKHRLQFRPGVQGVISPDGRRVLTAARDVQMGKHEAQMWDLANGEPIGSPMIHASTVSAAAFSPDGRWVLTASWDNTARVWDAQTGKPVSPPLAHDNAPGSSRGYVDHASFSPDGRWVLTAGYDRTARLWEAATGKLLHTLRHEKSVKHATFSPNGRRVVTALYSEDSSQDEVHIWDAVSGQPVGPKLRCQDSVSLAVFSPDGRWVASASGRLVQLWEADTGQPVGPPLHHQTLVKKVEFSPDGSRLLTVGYDTGSASGEVRLWTVARGEPAGVSLHHPQGMFMEAFSPDGRMVLTIINAQTAQVLEAATGRPVSPHLQHPGQVVFAKFSPDGRWVGTVSGRAAQIWEPNTGQRLCVTSPHSIPVRFLAFSADSRRFLTITGARRGRADGPAADQPDETRVWDTATGQPVGPVMRLDSLPFKPKIGDAALSPDGSRLITVAAHPGGDVRITRGDLPVSVWDVAQGKVLFNLEGATAGHVAFSPDGRWVLTYSSSWIVTAGGGAPTIGIGEVGLWEAATGKRIHTLRHLDSSGQRGLVMQGAVFSPDSRWVVTATGARIARVWEVATGQPVSVMQHQDFVRHLAFSPDSRRVVTISGSNAVQVWEAATGQPISPPLLHADRVNYASFSLDGRWVLTTSGGRTTWLTRLWDLSPDSRPTADLIRRAQLLRAMRIDQAGGYEPLTTAENQDAWQTLRTQYPQDFTVTPDQVRAWHRREAEACVREKNAPAAVFHYLHGSGDWLLRTAWMFPGT